MEYAYSGRKQLIVAKITQECATSSSSTTSHRLPHHLVSIARRILFDFGNSVAGIFQLSRRPQRLQQDHQGIIIEKFTRHPRGILMKLFKSWSDRMKLSKLGVLAACIMGLSIVGLGCNENNSVFGNLTGNYAKCTSNCAPGAKCETNVACRSGVCTNGTCVAPACTPNCPNATKCGVSGDCSSRNCDADAGVCNPPTCTPNCANTTPCALAGDCSSGVCDAGQCAPPACATSCGPGLACGASTDCLSQNCDAGKCAAPSCAPKCNNGTTCTASTDCLSQNCNTTLNRCEPPTCSGTCINGQGCVVGTDCLSGNCDPTTNTCAAPGCAAIGCSDGSKCSAPADCISKNCVSGICKAPGCAPNCALGQTCTSAADCGSKNCILPPATTGAYTCGPPLCSPKCLTAPTPQYCDVNGDCLSVNCNTTSHLCAAPTCANSCKLGQTCTQNGDCLSMICGIDNKCAPPVCSPNCPASTTCTDNTDCLSKVCDPAPTLARLLYALLKRRSARMARTVKMLPIARMESALPVSAPNLFVLLPVPVRTRNLACCQRIVSLEFATLLRTSVLLLLAQARLRNAQTQPSVPTIPTAPLVIAQD